MWGIDVDALDHLIDVALGASRLLQVMAYDSEGEDDPLSGAYSIVSTAFWDAATNVKNGGSEDGS